MTEAKMKRVDLAYTAGIIDGEGYIAIIKYRHPQCRVGFHYGVVVSVGMGNPTVPMWLHSSFGGSYGVYPPGKKGYKNRHVWKTTTRQAVQFLKLILPYLKEKVGQAEIVIEFQKGKSSKYSGQNPRPLVLIEADAVLAKRVSELNKLPVKLGA